MIKEKLQRKYIVAIVAFIVLIVLVIVGIKITKTISYAEEMEQNKSLLDLQVPITKQNAIGVYFSSSFI